MQGKTKDIISQLNFKLTNKLLEQTKEWETEKNQTSDLSLDTLIII